jgi:CRISPR-associated protein Csb1
MSHETLNPEKITTAEMQKWVTDTNGPVALHLKQRLRPVEGDNAVIFPPTYADIGYNIDTLSDGSKVVTIDSVGSQGNRMEPLFKSTGKQNGEEINPLAELVPQLSIKLAEGRYVSLLDLAHRAADATIKATPELNKRIEEALETLSQSGDAWQLCALAPTSLVFGMWDSRGGTGEKRPRLVRALIRAWDIEIIHSAAQFSSVWKSLPENAQDELKKEAAKKGASKLSDVGLADAPSIFRTDKVRQFVNDAPNPEARVLGGVIARGGIERTVTINLTALRAIHGASQEKTEQIRSYLLALAVLSASTDSELFLREGCLLQYADETDIWQVVPRRGEPHSTLLPGHDELLAWARVTCEPFRKDWPDKETFDFDLEAAKALLKKSGAEKAEE